MFKIANLGFKSAQNNLSKVKNLALKVPLYNSKSEKLNSESTILEPNIGTFGTRFCNLQTLILDFGKVVFCMSSKIFGLELIHTQINRGYIYIVDLLSLSCFDIIGSRK